VFQDYAQRVADITGFEFAQRFAPPAKEHANLSLRVRDDGIVVEVRVLDASSESARREAIVASMAASPLPLPPATHAACLAAFPLQLQLRFDRRRDCHAISAVGAHQRDLVDRVLDLLDVEGREIGSERVLLQIVLAQDGSVTRLTVLESPSDAASAKAIAAVEAAGPFPPPPEFADCYAEIPFLVWLAVHTRA
jgi:TonB family protein